MATITDLIIWVIYYAVCWAASWNFEEEIKALPPAGSERRLSPRRPFSSKHSIMADWPSPFHRARRWRGAPMCRQLRVGRRLVGVLGDGGCPLNLLIALWQSTSGEISHALLASRTVTPLQRWAFLTDTQEAPYRRGASYGFFRRASWVCLSAVCSKCEQMTLGKSSASTHLWGGFRPGKTFCTSGGYGNKQRWSL